MGVTGNIDETLLWLDIPIPGETTTAPRDERLVRVHTTGHENTVCLSAMPDGINRRPFVVFKGVRPISEL